MVQVAFVSELTNLWDHTNMDYLGNLFCGMNQHTQFKEAKREKRKAILITGAIAKRVVNKNPTLKANLSLTGQEKNFIVISFQKKSAVRLLLKKMNTMFLSYKSLWEHGGGYMMS